MNKLPEPTPEHQLKPQLVWLGKFLGMDIYMDLQPIKKRSQHAQLARRIFNAKLGGIDSNAPTN